MNKRKLIIVIGILCSLALVIGISIGIGISRTKEDKKSGLEIERKFLIETKKIPYKLDEFQKYSIIQSYINFSPEIRIRKVNNNYFFLTVKAAVDFKGMIREEREFIISQKEYNELAKKVEGHAISKTRYERSDGKNIISIDIYNGSLKGLSVMEIEFKNAKAANKYVPPSWVGKDVTSDKRYKNGSLAKYGLVK